jgi:hypothetical protein
MITLIETLLARCCKVVGGILSPKLTDGYRGDWECFGGMTLVIVPDLALQAVRAREKAVIRLIDQLKEMLG